MTAFGDKIRSTRKLKNIRQQGVIDTVNKILESVGEKNLLTQASLSGWETGRQLPSDNATRIIVEVCKVLGLDFDEIWSLTNGKVHRAKDTPFAEETQSWLRRIQPAETENDNKSVWLFGFNNKDILEEKDVLEQFLPILKSGGDLNVVLPEGKIKLETVSALDLLQKNLAKNLTKDERGKFNVHIIRSGVELDGEDNMKYRLIHRYWNGGANEPMDWKPNWLEHEIKPGESKISDYVLKITNDSHTLSGNGAYILFKPPIKSGEESQACLIVPHRQRGLSSQGQSHNFVWLTAQPVTALEIVAQDLDARQKVQQKTGLQHD